VRRDSRWHPTAVALILFLTCACWHTALGQATLNEWDVMSALRDIARRSIALEFIKVDPYRLVDATRRDTNLDAPLCSVKSVKEGLVSGTCNPLTMKKCGTRCIELSIDPGVYSRAAKQIGADLRTACTWLPALKLGQDRRDSRPSFFYLTRNRAIDALGCGKTSVEIVSTTFAARALTITYRVRTSE
jgi:hypothetical protein